MATKTIPAKLNESGNYEPTEAISDGIEFFFDITNRVYYYEEAEKKGSTAKSEPSKSEAPSATEVKGTGASK